MVKLPSSSYSKFEIPLSFTIPPDTMRIDIASSQFPFINIGTGSELYIDELQLSSAPLCTAVSEIENHTSFIISPNPASENTNVILTNKSRRCDVVIMDAYGKIISKFHSTDTQRMEINISNIPSGVYLIQVRTDNEEQMGKIVINR